MSDQITPKIAPDFGTAHCRYLLDRIEGHIKAAGPLTASNVENYIIDQFRGVTPQNAPEVTQWAIARLVSDGRIRLYDRGDALFPTFVWNPNAPKRFTPEALLSRIEAFLGDPDDPVDGSAAVDFLNELLEDLKDR